MIEFVWVVLLGVPRLGCIEPGQARVRIDAEIEPVAKHGDAFGLAQAAELFMLAGGWVVNAHAAGEIAAAVNPPIGAAAYIMNGGRFCRVLEFGLGAQPGGQIENDDLRRSGQHRQLVLIDPRHAEDGDVFAQIGEPVLVRFDVIPRELPIAIEIHFVVDRRLGRNDHLRQHAGQRRLHLMRYRVHHERFGRIGRQREELPAGDVDGVAELMAGILRGQDVLLLAGLRIELDQMRMGANADINLSGRRVVCDAASIIFPRSDGAVADVGETVVRMISDDIAAGIRAYKYFPIDPGLFVPGKCLIRPNLTEIMDRAFAGNPSIEVAVVVSADVDAAVGCGRSVPAAIAAFERHAMQQFSGLDIEDQQLCRAAADDGTYKIPPGGIFSKRCALNCAGGDLFAEIDKFTGRRRGRDSGGEDHDGGCDQCERGGVHGSLISQGVMRH